MNHNKNWTKAEILEAMVANTHFQMTYFAKYTPSMEILLEPDVTIVRSQIVDDTFNYVVSTHFIEENAHSRIAHVKNLFKKSNLPFSWWVSELDTPSTLGTILLKEGFAFKEKNVGMYLDLTKDLETSNSALDFKKVDSPSSIKHFADIIVSIGGSEDAFKHIYAKIPLSAYRENNPLEMYVGYLNGSPTVTGILVTHADVAGIYYVATTPNERKKGFGSDMMNHLLNAAKKKGYTLATLQASSEGLSLYERLGFIASCELCEYAPI